MHRTPAPIVGLALLLAVLGQRLLAGSLSGGREQGDRLLVGILLLVVGMAAFAWAAPRPTSPSSGVAGGQPWGSVRPQVLAAAGLLYVATLVLYLTVGENAVVRGGWLGSMALMLAAYIGPWQRPAWSREDGRDLILVTLMTALAFGLRFWRLAEIPSFFHGDIASQGLQALDIIRDPNPRWFGVGWAQIPLFDFVMMAWTMRLAGQDLFGLSLTAVWQGVLTVPLLYLLGREVGGRRVGLLAALLLTLDYTHIHFSRIVTSASVLMFLTLSLWAFWRGWHRRQLLWLAVSGLSLGIGMMVYYPIRVGAIVFAVMILGLLWQERRRLTTLYRPGMVFVLGALIGFGPMLGFVGQDFAAFVGRGSLVTLANPDVMTHLMNKYGVGTAGQVWIEQIQRSFLTFFLYPDSSTHFSFPGPMVAAPTAIFMALGVGYALRHARDLRLLMLLVWWAATIVLGSVLTNDPPFWPHTVVVLPAVCLLAAVAAERGLHGLIQAWPSARRAEIGWVLMGLLAVVFLLAGREGWRAYLDWVGNNADARVRIARFAWQSPASTRLVLVRNPFQETERELLFLAHDRDLLGVERDEVATFDADERPTVFILTPNHADLVPVLQTRWPQGVIAEYRSAEGAAAFLTYTVAPEGYAPGADPAAGLRRRSGVIWALALALTAVGLAAGFLIVRRGAPGDEAIPVPEPPPAPVVPVRRPPQPAAPHPAATPPTVPPEQLPTGTRLALVVGGVIIALVLATIAQRFYDVRLTGPVMDGLVRLFGGDLAAGRLLLVGTLFYLAAGVVFALAAPDLPLAATAQTMPAAKPRRDYPGELPPDARIIRPASKPRPTPNTTTAPVAPIPFDRVQGLWLAAAALPYAWAMLRFARQGEDGLVRGLWVVAVVLFLVGQVLWPLWHQWGRSAVGAEPSPRWQGHHLALLALVLAGGFWLRFNRLETIPDDFHGDMASVGLQAREWLAGITPHLFREGWANIPMKGFLPAALGLKVFGNNLFGLNMSAVIAGMLTLVGLYLLVWRLFDRHRLALLATAVLAINIPHIHFSRLASYMDPWPFHFLGLFAVVDGLRARRPASLALAGLLFGFGLEMYYSGRVLVLLVPPVFAYLLITRREWLRGQAIGYGLLVAGVLVALGPSLIYFAQFREPLVERSRAVWLFYEPVMTHLKGKYGVQSEWEVLWEQLKRSLLMFNQAMDSSTQFGYPRPMFSSLLSPLVVLGFAYSLRHWRHPGLGLNLILLMLIVIVGSALTGDAPFWPRLLGVLPAASLLAALMLDRLWALGEH
ncbi:MAG: glycosyltransferase family 39 protein, partial [Anaerolineae bacterium]|nr:glycosyltransferase family 39 protein [Anaerolineae bacterium]